MANRRKLSWHICDACGFKYVVAQSRTNEYYTFTDCPACKAAAKRERAKRQAAQREAREWGLPDPFPNVEKGEFKGSRKGEVRGHRGLKEIPSQKKKPKKD